MATVMLFLCVAVAGCSSEQLDKAVKQVFFGKTSSAELITAIENPDPDRRRQAVENIAKSDMVSEDWAITGFSAIARTDPDPHVRCAAIRALQRSGRPEAAEPLLQILNWRQHRDTVTTPPDQQVRWDATAVISSLCSWSLIPDALLDQTRQTLLRLLDGDTDQNVRLASARGLGCFPGNLDVVKELIAALDDNNFGVVYEAERSLIKLTGMTFECDPDAWAAWLKAADAPFARAGRLPDSIEPEASGWWQRSAARKALTAWQNDAKSQ